MFELKQICSYDFLVCVYTCFAVGDPIMIMGKVLTPLTGLSLSHLCACPKQGPGCPSVYMCGDTCYVQ
jgi:hypothetical protein